MSKFSRFTSKAVRLAKNAIGGRGEAAASEGDGGFADYAVVSFHCLWMNLEKSYHNVLDLLIEISHILAEIGLEEVDLPNHSMLVKVSDRFGMKIWRVLLLLSAQLHDTQISWQLARRNAARLPASQPTQATIRCDYARNCAKKT